MKNRIAAAVLCLALVVPSAAQPPAPGGGSGGGGSAGPRAFSTAETNLKIEVAARHGTLSDKASFVVANAAQANYVRGGDKSFEVKTHRGKGIEFKKHGFIVNVLPVVHPDDASKVTLQLQIELSGPVEASLTQDISTWQLQTEVVLKKGEKTIVADDEAYVEVTVSDFKPD